MKTLLYFGCMREAGHYWFGHNKGIDALFIELGINSGLIRGIDGTFPPANRQEGIYNYCLVPPAIILSWWDYSIDKRPGSNSNLLAVGYSNADEILKDAKIKFPEMINRQRVPLTMKPL